MKNCFYIFQALDMQDYLPVILESAKRNHKVFLYFFDITSKKRSISFYENSNIDNFLKKLFAKNNINLDLLTIRHFNKNSQNEYKVFYNHDDVDFVFSRLSKNIKYMIWSPVFDPKKIIYFIIKGRDIIEENPKSLFNVMRYNDELYFPKTGTNNSFYFGVLRYKPKNHVSLVSNQLEKILNNGKKTCFMIETWPRNFKYKQKTSSLLINTIRYLKSINYQVVWKSREKGLNENKSSYKDIVKDEVDLLIEKDMLNYPSSLYHMAKNSDMTITFDGTSSIIDSIYLSTNPVVIMHKEIPSRYIDLFNVCLGKRFKNYKKFINLYKDDYNKDVKKFLSNHLTPKKPQLLENIDTNLNLFFKKLEHIWNSNP